jgi:hypothetical protein
MVDWIRLWIGFAGGEVSVVKPAFPAHFQGADSGDFPTRGGRRDCSSAPGYHLASLQDADPWLDGFGEWDQSDPISIHPPMPHRPPEFRGSGSADDAIVLGSGHATFGEELPVVG